MYNAAHLRCSIQNNTQTPERIGGFFMFTNCLQNLSIFIHNISIYLYIERNKQHETRKDGKHYDNGIS